MFIPLSNAEKRDREWLWLSRIPLGAITNLEADPASGKSTLAHDIVARVTMGREMPDGSPGIAPANVVLLSSEDDIATTIVPRLAAAGADLSRVSAIGSVKLQSDAFRIPDDLHHLAKHVANTTAKLAVFDPLPAFIDSASTSDVRIRKSIGPLAQLGLHHNCALLAVRHFGKSDAGKAIHSGAGRLAYAAAARSVLAVVPDPNSADDYRRILVQTKSNLGPLAPSLAFRTTMRNGVVVIEWLERCDYSADDLLTDMQMHRSQRSHAMFVVYSILQNGPVPSQFVDRLAAEAGVAKRTLDRAKHDLDVRARKYGSGVGSFWMLELPANPELLAALRARDVDELMDALCHGVPEIAGGDPRDRRPGSQGKNHDDQDEDADDSGSSVAK